MPKTKKPSRERAAKDQRNGMLVPLNGLDLDRLKELAALHGIDSASAAVACIRTSLVAYLDYGAPAGPEFEAVRKGGAK